MSGTLGAILDTACRWPERLAAGELAYGRMIEDARRVGARLRHQGVARNDVVGLRLDRLDERLVCVLGCWLAGAAFEFGAHHTYNVDTAGFPAAVARGASLSGVVAKRPPDDLAYVSGALRVTHGELPARIAGPRTDDDAWILDVCATLTAGGTL